MMLLDLPSCHFKESSTAMDLDAHLPVPPKGTNMHRPCIDDKTEASDDA